jgi:hypothetical protein
MSDSVGQSDTSNQSDYPKRTLSLSTVCNSSLSLALPAATVCHCMLPGESARPALQRIHMIDHVAGASPARPASGRARMLPLEGVLGGGRSPDPPMPVPADSGRRGASGSMTVFVAADVGRRPRMASPGAVASTKRRGGQDNRGTSERITIINKVRRTHSR